MATKSDIAAMADRALDETVGSDPKEVLEMIPFGDDYLARPVGSFPIGALRCAIPVKSVLFSKSRTDQLHNQSIAAMVRQGQGSVLEEELNNYDFDENHKDNGTLEVPSMFESDWADPAERFEKEVSLKKEISSAVRREVLEKQALADASAKVSVEKAVASATEKSKEVMNERPEQ